MFFIPTNINIGNMKINSPDHGSGVYFGSNYLVGINTYGKKNQAFGQQMADFTISAAPVLITLDDEIIDTSSLKINK